MNRKPKNKTWSSLKEEKCPKCGNILITGMFLDLVGCPCGFVIDRSTKEVLVNRDKA